MWSVNIHERWKTLFRGDAHETMTGESSNDCIKGFSIGNSIIISMCPLRPFDFSLTQSGSRDSRFVYYHQLRYGH